MEIVLPNELNIGQVGPNNIGRVTVNGKDGAQVVLEGENGSVGLTGADGANSAITVKKGRSTLDNAAETPRISYGNEEVATFNYGLKFGENTGTFQHANLNTLV
ncbi:hypothetical protein, partial [Pasteurella multocida]|uniref:hypothetical protein n=1 Tax=Pasteurella multocida TaxID=747 RepID=UPI001B87C6EC